MIYAYYGKGATMQDAFSSFVSGDLIFDEQWLDYPLSGGVFVASGYYRTRTGTTWENSDYALVQNGELTIISPTTTVPPTTTIGTTTPGTTTQPTTTVPPTTTTPTAYGLFLYKEITSMGNRLVRLEIWNKEFSGEATEIAGLVSLSLNIDNQGGEIDTPIIKSNLITTFVDDGAMDYKVFFTPDRTKFKVVLKIDGETEWIGYITPDAFSYSLVYRGQINLIARDNLGLLNDVPFEGTGNIAVSDLINNCVNEIALNSTLSVRTTKVHNSGTIMNMVVPTYNLKNGNYYEALEKVLYSLGLQLRFVGKNTYAIFDLKDLKDYGNSEIPQEFIFINKSGMYEIIPGWKKVKVSHDYNFVNNIYEGIFSTYNFSKTVSFFGLNVDYYTPPFVGDTWYGNMQLLKPSDFNEKKETLLLSGNTLGIAENPRYIIYNMIVSALNSAIKITFTVSNALLRPQQDIWQGIDLFTDKKLFQYNFGYQIKIRCNVFYTSGGSTYILKSQWELFTGDITNPDSFIELMPSASAYLNYQDEDLEINIYNIRDRGDLRFVFYNWEATTAIDKDYILRIKDFAINVDDKNLGNYEETITVDANKNILGSIDYTFGSVPFYLGNALTLKGGFFETGAYSPPAYNFGYGVAQNLLLRDIVTAERKYLNGQRIKLSGQIKGDLDYSRPFIYEGASFVLNYGTLDLLRHTMDVELIEALEVVPPVPVPTTSLAPTTTIPTTAAPTTLPPTTTVPGTPTTTMTPTTTITPTTTLAGPTTTIPTTLPPTTTIAPTTTLTPTTTVAPTTTLAPTTTEPPRQQIAYYGYSALGQQEAWTNGFVNDFELVGYLYLDLNGTYYDSMFGETVMEDGYYLTVVTENYTTSTYILIGDPPTSSIAPTTTTPPTTTATERAPLNYYGFDAESALDAYLSGLSGTIVSIPVRYD